MNKAACVGVPNRPRRKSIGILQSGPKSFRSFAKLGFLRPCDLAVVLVCQIHDLTCASRGNTGLHRSVGLLAALHAVKEILHVVEGSVAETICPDHRILPARYA